MNYLSKKISFLLIFFGFCIFFLGTTVVNAAGVTVGNITNSTFTISRSITDAKSVVNNTFTYTIEAAATNPSGASNIPTSATVTFDNVSPVNGTATATGMIDLSGASFTKNGDYKYVVREDNSSDAVNYPLDQDNFYTIQVSVRNDGSSDFSGKVVSIVCFNASNEKLNDSTLVFTKGGNFTYISITNTVEGNMGDVDKYFSVLVTIEGHQGDTYTIEGQTCPGANTTYTVGQDNYICIKHGETIKIGKNGSTSEIPIGLNYSFVEQDATEYVTNINSSPSNNKESGNLVTAASNSNTIRNYYEDLVVTGLFMKILPYALLVVVTVLVIIYLVIRNKKVKKDEK